MKKNSILTFAIFLTAIIAFAVNASAENADLTTFGTVRSIICPGDEQADIFDYNEYVSPGYCSSEKGDIVFNICSCPIACAIQEGDVLGIHMKILSPGIYWAFDSNVTKTPDADGSNPADNSLDIVMGNSSRTSEILNACYNRQFSNVGYYSLGMINDANLRRPVAGPADSIVNGVNDAKIMTLPLKTGGNIIAASDTIGKRCSMRIDIPKMILNAVEYQEAWSGDEILIKISIFSERPMARDDDQDVQVVDFDGNTRTIDSLWHTDFYSRPDYYEFCQGTMITGKFCCKDGICDINDDGKTGLEEAVHALQVVAGIR